MRVLGSCSDLQPCLRLHPHLSKSILSELNAFTVLPASLCLLNVHLRWYQCFSLQVRPEVIGLKNVVSYVKCPLNLDNSVIVFFIPLLWNCQHLGPVLFMAATRCSSLPFTSHGGVLVYTSIGIPCSISNVVVCCRFCSTTTAEGDRFFAICVGYWYVQVTGFCWGPNWYDLLHYVGVSPWSGRSSVLPLWSFWWRW